MKVRRVDYYPDEYIAGVGNVLRADEAGVYWMVCTLIMSEGGPIPYNDRRLAGLCMIRPSQLRRIIEKLVDMGKLGLDDGNKLYQKRAQSEVERASKRIQSASENGAKGGRPSQKTQENQDKGKAIGLSAEKLTTNHQPPTTNQTPPYKSPQGDEADDDGVGFLDQPDEEQGGDAAPQDPNPPDDEPELANEATWSKAEIDALFERFWSACPRKVGKQKARQKFGTALTRHRADPEAVIAAMERYAESRQGEDPKYTVHPATWLNEGRWQDEDLPATSQEAGGKVDIFRVATENAQRMEDWQ
ncbi:DUF1376 domain-containing protein [Fodinicurvata sediminis]|uniref:DUF1376 domain-containing protein n=1 Tax=Fodinicurvata sediminis TaxID=1121832 RepID=UPI0003B3D790|nr:DUF1376 domain-containing protein [Fodinicurvata sediminis]